MAKLDRELQKRVLSELADLYPHKASMKLSFKDIPLDEVMTPNLHYLSEFGMVDVNWAPQTSSTPLRPHAVSITAKGMDFLADDGGLSAVLGVVTVKLHEDTIKELLIERVEASTASPSVKAKIIEQLKSLPADSLKTMTMVALKAGLEQIPDAVRWLQKWLGP